VIGKKDMVIKKEKWDGKSRPSNKAYEENWNRIFGKKTEENRWENFKTTPMYKAYRDRQNAMARDRRKARKNDNG